MNSPETS